jgi:drug/metabolite transporter (DMT)-like permease
VIISAVIHAGWNLYGQQRQVTPGFFFVACFAAAFALSPFLWIYRAVFPQVPLAFWAFVIGSGVFEGLYYVSLCGAYREGDLSATYPLIRAVPVVLVALISLAVGGPNRPEGLGLIGVGLVGLGCLALPLNSFLKPRLGVYLLPASILAFFAGIGTTGYSLADDRALRILTALPAGSLPAIIPAVFFLALKTLSSTLALGVILLARPVDRSWFRHPLRSELRLGMITGLLIFGAYGLVLAAMALATNVSYVVAFRQISIPLGAMLGFMVNKDKPIPTRLAGIGLIVVGLVLVAAG